MQLKSNKINLNHVKVSPRWGDEVKALGRDHTHHEFTSVQARCVFRNLDKHLIKLIGQYDAVFGCVAWLTEPNILKALSKCDSASLVVQKEDFLRPDRGSSNKWKQELQKSYKSLRCYLSRMDIPGVRGGRNGDGSLCAPLESVRCVGVYNSRGDSAIPRMHNKFLVLGNVESQATDKYDEYIFHDFKPKAVWTGSFNFTKNGGYSLENAVIIIDDTMAQAYFDEWQQIYAISEPLNWEQEWCAPEY